MKAILFLIALSTFFLNVLSQSYNNNWVFGDSAGLNFNTGIPDNYTSSIMTYESCASISDSVGGLLFYTNGEKVWNRMHEVMFNGDGLEIGAVSPPYGSSNTQGTIIIPRPGYSDLYYIFNNASGIGTNVIKYSIVDIAIAGGLGGVSDKNIHVCDINLEEKMAAVRHGNGRDWWLIFRSVDISTNPFKAYFTRFLITPTYISGPINQEIGPDYEEGIDVGLGQLVFSQDGCKLLYPRGPDLNVYTFDRCSGELSNLIEIKNVDEDFISYGCSFSPDGRLVYVSDACGKQLYQFCISCADPVDSTKELIYQGPSGDFCQAQHLLGPDGKIYLATPYSALPNDVFNSKNQNLSVINSPNEQYPFCDFDTNTISLGDRRVITGLPNMPNYNLGALEGSPCDTLVAINNDYIEDISVMIYPNPAEDFIRLELAKTEIIKSIKTINYLGEEIELAFDENLKARVTNIVPGFYITVIVTEKDRISINWEKL